MKAENSHRESNWHLQIFPVYVTNQTSLRVLIGLDALTSEPERREAFRDTPEKM